MLKKKVFTLLICLGVLISGLYAEGSQKILNIEVHGNKLAESRLVVIASRLEIGDFFTLEKARIALEKLYSLGLFELVKIEQESLPEGLSIHITVTENPYVRKVKFVGNKKLNEDELRDVMTVREDQFVKRARIVETRFKFEELYKEKGYYLVEISAELETAMDEPDKKELVFTINEGKKVKVDKIFFEGVSGVSEKKLRKALETKQDKWWWPASAFDEKEFEEDLNRVVAFYKQQGFLDAQVLNHVLDFQEGELTIRIQMQEGQQYRLGDVHFAGNEQFDDDALMRLLPMQAGDIFDETLFQKFLFDASSLYYEEGYIYCHLEPTFNKVEDQVQVDVAVEEGTPARVRKIMIRGNTRTEEKVFRRELAIAPGYLFKRSLIFRSQRNINVLGLTSPNIQVDPQPINDQGDVDITFTLEEQTTGTANFGAGYGSEGVSGFFELSHNNLFGKNWRTNIKWEFGKTSQDIELGFTEPYLFGKPILAGGSVYHTFHKWSDSNYKVKQMGFSVRGGAPFRLLDYSRFQLIYSYYAKDYDFINSDEDDLENTSQAVIDYVNRGQVYSSTVGCSFVRDSRDDIFMPTEGSNTSILFEIAGGWLGGDEEYFKQTYETNWYLRLYDKFVLMNRARFGYITSLTGGEEPPLDEKFYPGGRGVNGIRGYEDNEFGGDDGRRVMTIFGSELSYPLVENQIRMLLFFDAGHGFDRWSEASFDELYKGVGLGLRIQTPFAPLGFDYGYGMDKEKWRFHFQFGTAF